MESAVKLHLAMNGNQKIFTGHGTGYVSVNGHRHEQSLIVMAGQLRTDWGAASFDDLNEEHFSYFLALKPQVILLGTGHQQRFVHPQLYRSLINAGIGVECMNTAAACRTYNILVAEDRHVIAAILMR
jgi:uncharacterized protein